MKKITAIICTLILIAVIPLSVSAKTILIGDVNNDGKVNAADARLVLRRAAQLVTFTADQDWLADVDDDGDVTAKDARIILRVAAGLEEFEF